MTKDEALSNVDKLWESIRYGTDGELLSNIEGYIKEQPEIVLCKDCKHAVHDGEGYICADFDKYVDDDFYCKGGERKW